MSHGDTHRGSCLHLPPFQHTCPVVISQGSFCLGGQKRQAEGGSPPLILGPNLSDLRGLHQVGTPGAAFGVLESAHNPSLRSWASLDQE